jgi:amino acid adenylation domain-containing protein
MSRIKCGTPPTDTIWDVFDRVADQFPDRTALVYADPDAPRSWTYQELSIAAHSAAAEFAACGVKPGDFVAVIADRQLETVAAYLATALHGAAYLPIDPRFPKERIGYMLRDAAPSLVLVDRSLDLEFAGAVRRLSPGCFADSSRFVPVMAGNPECPAYIMYTSGSTGTPKGVVVPHQGVIRLLCGADYHEFGPGTVFLQLAPLSFDAAILEIWGGLLNGGQCVLFPRHGVPDLDLLRQTIERYGITTLWMTASLFNGLINADATLFAGINTIFVGGEALSLPHIRMAQAALPNTTFINGYGPTENSTFTTCFTIPRPVPEAWRSIPIGRPIAGTTAYVLDQSGCPVERGQTGELYVGGYGVALGYLNKPELTAERFVPDPFIGQPGMRMYKTGDLVRDLGDGVLDYLGRNDTQVKIRGNRIELGEIENLLLSHPRVNDARVRVKIDGNGEKHLVAYYLTDGVDLDTLHELLAENLPSAVAPSHVIRLAYMPLNENGKLDESRLPNPFEGDRLVSQSRHCSLMQTPVEWASIPELIEILWRLVLPSGRVFGRMDSFFEVGGTSLGTLQIAAKLSRELDRPVPVIKLFEFPTIERLAAYLLGTSEQTHLVAGKDRAARAREARQRRRASL